MDLVGLAKDIVLPAFVGGGTAWLVVAFLGKRLVEHRLVKDLEKFKTELSNKSGALKTELSIYAHEQSVVISRIDAQRADAIKSVFASFRAWSNSANKVIAGCPFVNSSPEHVLAYYSEWAEKAHDLGRTLMNNLADHAIYFDDATYGYLGETSDLCATKIAAFLRPIRQGAGEGAEPNTLLSTVDNAREDLVKSYEEDLGPRLANIAEMFRNILGSFRA